MGNKPTRKGVIEIKRIDGRTRTARQNLEEESEQPSTNENSTKTEKEPETQAARKREQYERPKTKTVQPQPPPPVKPPPRQPPSTPSSRIPAAVAPTRQSAAMSPTKPQEPVSPAERQEVMSTPRPARQSTKPDTRREPQFRNEQYASALDVRNINAARKKENFLIRVVEAIGVTQMSSKDFTIMFILWSMRFLVPWTYAWWEFNKHILSDPAHLDALSNWLTTQEILAFIGCCAICVVVSFFADIFNLKYYVYLGFLLMYILCPVTGIVAINILSARGYDSQVYHVYSPRIYIMMEWVKAIPFIVFPVEFSCFFTQVDGMPREAHYHYAVVFILLDSANRLICFYIVPDQCPTQEWTLASVWIVIGVLMHTLFLLSCFFIKFVKPANKILNRTSLSLKVIRPVNKVLVMLKMKSCTINETGKEEKQDNFNEKATPFMKKMKLILFGLVLVPIIFSSFVIAILHRLELDEDWDRHEFLNATGMFYCGKVLGLTVIAVLLYLLRRNEKIAILNKYPVTKPDVLALGLPHVLIVLALLIVAARFGSLLSLEEGDVMIGPIPDAEVSVVEFYNADFRNRTVCVSSEKFRSVKISPRQRETRVTTDPGVSKYEITVSMTPRSTPPVINTEILEFQINSLITYVITLNSSAATATDLEAMYNMFYLRRVSGTNSVKPKTVPQMIFINTFMTNTSSYYFTLKQYQTNFTRKIQLPPIQTAHVEDVVDGRVDVSYENQGNSQQPTPPIITYINVENYTIWSIVLGLATAHNASNKTEPFNVILTKHLIMQVAGPNGNPLPSKRQLQQDKAIMIGMFLGGMAESGMLVGYIYLFWLDTPIGGLRATTLAAFLIAVTVPQEFPRLKLVDISTGVAIAVLILQVLFTACHFMGAIFLYDDVFDFRLRED